MGYNSVTVMLHDPTHLAVNKYSHDKSLSFQSRCSTTIELLFNCYRAHTYYTFGAIWCGLQNCGLYLNHMIIR